LATYLDPILKDELYEVFIENKILMWRDIGGDNFKEFNDIIDTLPDRIGRKNKGVYIQVSKIIRDKLDILDTRGYNEEEHNALVQKKRTEYLSNLTSMVKVGLVTNYPKLKDVLIRL
jgi:hypothetical protein